jgi:hypothetical protein
MVKYLLCTGNISNNRGDIIKYQCFTLGLTELKGLSHKRISCKCDYPYKIMTSDEIKEAVNSGEYMLGPNIKITSNGRIDINYINFTNSPRLVTMLKNILDELVKGLNISFGRYYIKQLLLIQESKRSYITVSSINITGLRSEYLPDFKSLMITASQGARDTMCIAITLGRTKALDEEDIVKSVTEEGSYQLYLPSSIDSELEDRSIQGLCAYTVHHLRTTKRGNKYDYTENHTLRLARDLSPTNED